MGLKFGELLILLLIVMIFFGGKRLPSLGGALGEAIKNFKKGLKGDDYDNKIDSSDHASKPSSQAEPEKPTKSGES